MVPGTQIPGPRCEGTIPDDLAAALAAIRPDARLVSICTGAFVLAAAGLLDGRPATTHWKYAEEFARLYPAVELDEAVLFTDDGDVLTSAGLSAGVDLCLHLIRRDHGTALAVNSWFPGDPYPIPKLVSDLQAEPLDLSSPLRQMVFLAIEPQLLDLSLSSVRRHLSFINRIVILTKSEFEKRNRESRLTTLC